MAWSFFASPTFPAFMSILVGLGILVMLLSAATFLAPRTAPTVRFGLKPAILEVKTRRDGDKWTERRSLQELLETRCQSLFSVFKPVWWLFNGQLQTIYCVMADFSKIDRVIYRRKYLQLADGGTLGLDFATDDRPWHKQTTPVIVVVAGLTGGSYEPYIRAILSKACASVNDGGLGYRAVVVNFRGCAGVPITSPQLYSAGHTDDFRQSLVYISHLFPEAPLLGIGFSMGANMITRYIAEEGEKSRLRSCCSLSSPWNLVENNRLLLSTYLGKEIFSRALGSNFTKVVKRNYKGLTMDPNHIATMAANDTMALKKPTLDEFDQTFTCRGGGPMPPFPFEKVDDYYRWASSHNVLHNIRVPFLAINADDDPFVQDVPRDGGANGYVVLEMTAGGGHLGWFQFGNRWTIERWTTRPVLEWFKLTGDDIIHEANKASEIFQDSDGFLKERSRPDLGCKELRDGGLIDWSTVEMGTLQGL